MTIVCSSLLKIIDVNNSACITKNLPWLCCLTDPDFSFLYRESTLENQDFIFATGVLLWLLVSPDSSLPWPNNPSEFSHDYFSGQLLAYWEPILWIAMWTCKIFDDLTHFQSMINRYHFTFFFSFVLGVLTSIVLQSIFTKTRAVVVCFQDISKTNLNLRP